MSIDRSSLYFFLIVLLVASVGCSQYPEAPELPKFSARKASSEAVRLNDKNEDGKLEESEWTRSPTLSSIADRIDKDEDKILTNEEIANYLRGWQQSPSFIVAAMPTFYLDGEPLAGATITLDAAEFLGSSYPEITATTNADGTANFKLVDASYPGVYSGLYRVRVSKKEEGKETIPARYNVETELGCEFSKENWTTCVRWFPLESAEN